jgi:aminodeoxyfutalosine synthase
LISLSPSSILLFLTPLIRRTSILHPYLSPEEGLALYDLPLGELLLRADAVKRSFFQDQIFYIKNYYINLTNICRYACKYCGFRRNPGDPDSYTLPLDGVIKKLQNAPEAISEVWFSSGLNSALPYSYYLDLLREVKKILPKVQIKAFTAVEIDFLSKHFKKPWDQILDDLIDAGLDRIPAGGAEIFDDRIRKKIDIKTRPEDYLGIHRLCHKKGMKTSVTMLFGHVEEREHRIQHMVRLRDFQEESRGVQAFIPLAYQDHNNPLAKKGIRGPSPLEILKTLAISRLMLPNVEHIQSFWVDSGSEITQIAIHGGVDDINGTLIEENIAHESGSPTKSYEPSENLVRWIRGAGLVPVERDALFRVRTGYPEANP